MNPQWDTLELKWGQKSRSMSDDGFKKTLQIMADHGLKVRPRFMIIDATEFFHTFGEGTLAWRDEHIVPLYNDAGSRSSPSSSPTACPGRWKRARKPVPDGPARFPAGSFETRERMFAWLTS